MSRVGTFLHEWVPCEYSIVFMFLVYSCSFCSWPAMFASSGFLHKPPRSGSLVLPPPYHGPTTHPKKNANKSIRIRKRLAGRLIWYCALLPHLPLLSSWIHPKQNLPRPVLQLGPIVTSKAQILWPQPWQAGQLLTHRGQDWMVLYLSPPKNMKVNWDDYSWLFPVYGQYEMFQTTNQ